MAVAGTPTPHPPPFSGGKILFSPKIGKKLNVYMWITCQNLFIEQDTNDKN